MRVMVITPTTGKDTVVQAIESVNNQTVFTEHLVVIDGSQAEQDLGNIKYDWTRTLTMKLPENVGGNGWYGHRVYAAMPLMVNADYILFLDEDNWFEPNHVETMINTIEANDLMWAYSLRKVYNEQGEYICDDDGESVGNFPTYRDNNCRIVDTNCYCFKREHLVKVAHAIYGQWGADRQFFDVVSKVLPKFACTAEATVNYTAKEELCIFIMAANELTAEKYGSNPLPWRQK